MTKMRPLFDKFSIITTDRHIWCSHGGLLILTRTKQTCRLVGIKHYVKFNPEFITHCQQLPHCSGSGRHQHVPLCTIIMNISYRRSRASLFVSGWGFYLLPLS